MTEQLVLIDFNFLSRLLNHNNLRISLLEPACLCFNLKETIDVTHLDS